MPSLEVSQKNGVKRSIESKNTRRRFADPTTTERYYTEYELEFMDAVRKYIEKSGRKFPSFTELLEVLLSLGYKKTGTPFEINYKSKLRDK